MKASAEDGESIDVYYSNGIARFKTIPEVVKYSCYTGRDNISMDVKIGEAGYLTVTLNNHVYRLFTKGESWTNAKDYCESVGGHLMTTTSTDEIDLAVGLLSKAMVERDTNVNYCWLGGNWRDDGEDNMLFYWVTSEDWNTIEPIAMVSGGNLAIRIDSSDIRLAWMGSNYALPFICECESKTASFTQLDPMYQLWSDDPKAYYSGDVSCGERPSPLSLSHLSDTPPARDRTGGYNPPKYDPRDNSLMPSVKDQGNYGTCWSFASIGALESSYAAQFNEKAPDLSELHQAWYAYMAPRPGYRIERGAVQLVGWDDNYSLVTSRQNRMLTAHGSSETLGGKVRGKTVICGSPMNSTYQAAQYT